MQIDTHGVFIFIMLQINRADQRVYYRIATP